MNQLYKNSRMQLTRAKYLTKFTLRPFKEFTVNTSFRKNMLYAYFFNTFKVRKNMALFESFHGSKIGGNTFAIFKKMLHHPDYKHFRFVLVLNEMNPHAQEFAQYSNVTFVKRDSVDYLKYLVQAKYLINDTTFPFYFQKKEEQVYVNTWHGTPIKTLGKDVKGTLGQHKNAVRNFLQTDFILNPNRFTADVITRAHDLTGIYEGKIVDEGYPRTDLTLHADKSKVKADLEKTLGVPLNKKIILYAPTWRGEIGKINDNKDELTDYIKELHEKLPEDYIFLLKVHDLTYRFIKDDESLKQVCIPDWFETNELLSIVDILITDYSSIFFDYMVTKKPILFFVYDKEKYEKERGLYLDLHDMPGPLCKTVEEVVQSVVSLDDTIRSQQTKYNQAFDTYCYSDDGGSTNRILDIIFQQQDSRKTYQINDSSKTKILLYGGGFTTNGVTSSVLNLLNNLDYSKVDVTVMFGGKIDATTEKNLERIHPNVRVLYKMGTFNYTLSEYYKHQLIMNSGLNRSFIQKHIPTSLYQKELTRLVGDAKFDIAVDFSGYAPFWTLMFAFNEFKKKAIYLHSDMVADSERETNGKQKFKKNFSTIFRLYPYFNKLVSVSKDATDINKESLKKYGVSNNIVNVDNSLDYNRVLNHLDDGKIQTIFDKDYLVFEHPTSEGVISLTGVEIPSEENVNFVSLGRLSPEKDQQKLIKAFAKVHQEFPQTRLYLIGNGPLKIQLTELIEGLDLQGKVLMVGELNQPFGLLNQCDCFVLSSNYEGQGLVILESLALNKPVISTDIPGPKGILQDGYGKLVDNSEEGLAEGMKDFIRRRPSYKPFDYVSYNEQAMETFYKEVCKIH